MKRLLLCLALIPAAATLTARAQNATPATPTAAAAATAQRSADGKTLNLSVTLPQEMEVGYQEVLNLSYYLVSEDGAHRLALDSLSVAGTMRNRIIKRHTVRGNAPGVPLMPRLITRKQLPQTLTFAVPFEPWMATSTLRQGAERYGCAACVLPAGESTLLQNRLRLFGPDNFLFRYIEPAAVAVKTYSAQIESYINFVVDRHELLRDYKNNARELAALDKFVREALELEKLGATLTTLTVRGYASPEATQEHNQALSERRTKTLGDYVMRTHFEGHTPPVGLDAKGMGENWSGLRDAVDKSSMPYRREILQIIDNYTTEYDRESRIKALNGGRVYQYLLHEVYPSLRRSTFAMGYTVRPYTVQELPDIYKKDPKIMSHHELYLLAQSQVEQGVNPTAVYRTAYELFPAEEASLRNYINALLEYDKDGQTALQLLDKLPQDKETTLLRATALYLTGRTTAADELYYSIPQ